MAHIGDRACLVVGQAIYDDCGAGDAVAFIADLLVVRAFQAADAALDGALDVILGHIVRIRLVHSEPQPWIAGRVPATQPGRNGDFLDQAREDLPALSVLAVLAMLDVCPFTVAGHQRILQSRKNIEYSLQYFEALLTKKG